MTTYEFSVVMSATKDALEVLPGLTCINYSSIVTGVLKIVPSELPLATSPSTDIMVYSEHFISYHSILNLSKEEKSYSDCLFR